MNGKCALVLPAPSPDTSCSTINFNPGNDVTNTPLATELLSSRKQSPRRVNGLPSESGPDYNSDCRSESLNASTPISANMSFHTNRGQTKKNGQPHSGLSSAWQPKLPKKPVR
ncbi:unnamed protein product [Protopolystoma xenopodis]|uniref:Uncharacterized protein n=1 Tax=Protopolystoma xenopodis TaxID=117903 RepID=A0A3S5CFQ2_9PLAT|nr:unnamed protein product [Protopolystoma xenopodis]